MSFNRRTFQAMAHFSLFRVVEALEKKSFFGGEIRGRCRLKAVEAEFFVKTKRRKAFYIIPNYRQWGICQERSLSEWKATFGGCFAYNFDYVICCGGFVWESWRVWVEENVFFEVRAGYLIQNASERYLCFAKILFRKHL